ncbi:MAG: hypothetical protein M0Q44_15365 [Methylobacter sp.]|jgi:hypothetical protein|nr:hypothetical protein [Methylobacter sp.]
MRTQTNLNEISYRCLACALITLLFMAHTAHWLHIPTLQRMENILYDLRLRTTVVVSMPILCSNTED